jgi:hypothetical protein
MIGITVFQGGDGGRVYSIEIFVKYPGVKIEYERTTYTSTWDVTPNGLLGSRQGPRAKPGQTGPPLGTQPSTYAHSSTAVISEAKGRTIYQHRHYKPTLLALLRCL